MPNLSVTISIFLFIIIIVSSVILQIFLSLRKNKWLGASALAVFIMYQGYNIIKNIKKTVDINVAYKYTLTVRSD